jgi:hypothetical protein
MPWHLGRCHPFLVAQHHLLPLHTYTSPLVLLLLLLLLAALPLKS